MKIVEPIKEYVVDFYSTETGKFMYSRRVFAASAGDVWNAVQSGTASYDRAYALSVYCVTTE